MGRGLVVVDIAASERHSAPVDGDATSVICVSITSSSDSNVGIDITAGERDCAVVNCIYEDATSAPASNSISLGDAQPLECDGAARDLDDAPRILAIEDGLPGILRSNRDVLADLEHSVAAPRVVAIGELEDVTMQHWRR